MRLSREMEEALSALENAEAEFDAIDEELDQLAKKIAFFSSASSFPSDASRKAVQECEQHITAHEKAINRPLAHFNKLVSRCRATTSLNVVTATPAVLQSIDELVRVHLCETGYASVGEAMQKEAPGQALGSDLLVNSYAYESYIDESLHHITGGEVGAVERTRAAKRISSALDRELDEAETLLYTYHNAGRLDKSHDASSPAELVDWAPVLEAQELLASTKHLVQSQRLLDVSKEEESWQRAQAAEYKFLKCLRHGIGAALEYLQSLAGCINPEKVAEFAGKLITVDTESADEDINEFLLHLRTQLLNRARGDVLSSAIPATDLKLLTDIGLQAQQKYLVPLQTAEWSSSEELPVEIETSPANDLHPIFVCPVTKEQDRTGELVLLPCGHLLSPDAVAEILGGESQTSEKCPYCPEAFCSQNTKLVTLPQNFEEIFARFLRRMGSPVP